MLHLLKLYFEKTAKEIVSQCSKILTLMDFVLKKQQISEEIILSVDFSAK